MRCSFILESVHHKTKHLTKEFTAKVHLKENTWVQTTKQVTEWEQRKKKHPKTVTESLSFHDELHIQGCKSSPSLLRWNLTSKEWPAHHLISGYTDPTPGHTLQSQKASLHLGQALRNHKLSQFSCKTVLCSLPGIAVLQVMSSLLCNLIAQLRVLWTQISLFFSPRDTFTVSLHYRGQTHKTGTAEQWYRFINPSMKT